MKLNGFLASFIVAGIIFFLGSLITQPSVTKKMSLALFSHSSLDEQPETRGSLKTEDESASDVEIFCTFWYHVEGTDVRRK